MKSWLEGMKEMKDPLEVRENAYARAKDAHERCLRQIPRDNAAYWDVYQIAREWVTGAEDRKATSDTSIPVYLRLRLGKKDDLCVEAMLFLEELEEEYGECEQVNIFGEDSDTLVAYRFNKFVVYFTVGESTKCKVVTERETKTTTQVTGRKVVCW